MPLNRRLLQFAAFVAVAPLAMAVDLNATFAELDRAAARELWPGFDPSKMPVAVYDGAQTWLRNHPSPPREFAAVADSNSLRVFKGLHESVRANTSVELGSALTATVMLDRSPDITPRAAAALIAHECFHVYERQHHPEWQANEAVLFTYPVEDARAASLAVLEREALKRAVETGDRCWAAKFASLRKDRFASIGPEAAQYERLAEVNEGLAQRVQNVVGGVKPDMSREFGPAEVRDRAYTFGPAIAAVLDAVAPGWKTRVRASLDELVPTAAPETCAFTQSERDSAAATGQRQIQAIVARRAELQRTFDSAAGWRVVIEAAPGKPLMPAGFDPSNVERLDGGRVLHARWLKLANAQGSAEAMNHRSLTMAAGKHPLFNGAKTWTVLLDEQPETKVDGGTVWIKGSGFELKFDGAKAERGERLIRVRLE